MSFWLHVSLNLGLPWLSLKCRRQKIQVQSLGPEVPLEDSLATHSDILAWEIPWTESLASYAPWGREEPGTA